jgi:ATP/ADP translocase
MKERLYVGRKSSTRECVKVMELASVFFFFFFFLFAFISLLEHDISSFEFDF